MMYEIEKHTIVKLIFNYIETIVIFGIIIYVIGFINGNINNMLYPSIFMFIVLTSIELSCSVPWYIKNKFLLERYKKIRENGERVEGTIIRTLKSTKINKGYIHRSSPYQNTRFVTRYSVEIEYVDPNTLERKTFVTPDLSFDPSGLENTECSVYVYNGMEYATDFAKKSNSKVDRL
ncbi:MAG: hypothetical protein IKP28_05450 [Clostridia bacterium]|nr:hypothetical protein [Clostridia bacterium]